MTLAWSQMGASLFCCVLSFESWCPLPSVLWCAKKMAQIHLNGADNVLTSAVVHANLKRFVLISFPLAVTAPAAVTTFSPAARPALRGCSFFCLQPCFSLDLLESKAGRSTRHLAPLGGAARRRRRRQKRPGT